jgi:hypothetical protein
MFLLFSVSKKNLFLCVLDQKVSSARRAMTENKSLLFVNDCFEGKPNAAIGVFMQALFMS